MNNLEASELLISKDLKVICSHSNRSLFVGENRGRLEITGDCCIVKVGRNSPGGEILISGKFNLVEVKVNQGKIGETEEELNTSQSSLLSDLSKRMNSNHLQPDSRAILENPDSSQLGQNKYPFFEWNSNQKVSTFVQTNKGSTRQNKIKVNQELTAAVPPSYTEIASHEVTRLSRI